MKKGFIVLLVVLAVARTVFAGLTGSVSYKANRPRSRIITGIRWRRYIKTHCETSWSGTWVTVNIINTPGGSGIPAVQSVLTAPADGLH